MKKKKNKEISLVNIIDFGTEKLLFLIKKLNKLITSKVSHDTIYIFSKIIITLIVLWLIKIPFDAFEEFGVALIYTLGTSFRHILSACLRGCFFIGYLVLCFIVLLKVIGGMFADKELNFIEKDRRKDAKVKKKVFSPLINIIKVCLNILLIPFVIAVLAILIALGMAIALLVYSYPLYGLFPLLIGLLIMILSVILIVRFIVNGGVMYTNKYVNMLFGGFLLFIAGMVCLNFEFTSFNCVGYLPEDFYTYSSYTRLSVNDSINYRIKRGTYNENITINKKIDDALNDEIVIVEEYTNTSKITTKVTKDKNDTVVVLSNEFNLYKEDIKRIYNLVIKCLKDRTIYNYNLLKYSRVTVYGNEEVLSNIKVDGYGI